ncbi:LLM class flavin-dependent oxidoreductase [Pseudonocardia sp. KRD291]|uniref:LLM class flavin-dependent oxidoreductase n=1 Tax=Pseudonocardia sp. KRD291 TaxID=2792007 RepID=UPI001C4A204E|nr:LLM class flavin-dependent oxidoreductase [Pseudonocardia sp. KRD291]MBW0103850.1 LLM class flavin-dependent oxidoreductase [Pseudonocardia sp. KRD291]
MRLGYLSHVAGDDPATVYRETIELAVLAEELGYSSFWVAQHHAGHLGGLLPSPLVLLAAVAAQTLSIRLGTGVVAAPLQDPLRLAEDAAVLDEISGGRVELGIGAGADPAASARSGRDHDRRHADCRAVVDRLCERLGEPDLTPARPTLRDRIWWATGSSSGVDEAAARGIGVVSGRPARSPDGADTGVAADLARYWTYAAGPPRVLLSRPVHPGRTPDAVAAEWADDPAMPWADEILVQAQPATAAGQVHRTTMRMVAEHLGPLLAAGGPAPPAAGTGPVVSRAGAR